MHTVTALFDDYEHAASAVRALESAGFSSKSISLIVATLQDSVGSPEPERSSEPLERAGTGAGIGAVVGGASGLLASLGAMAIPGVGAVLAGGWLISAAMGAVAGAAVGGATGGMVAALTHSGLHEDEAHVLAEGIRRGGTVVSVRTDAAGGKTAEKIFEAHHRVDLAARRRTFEATGWERFDPDAPAFVEDPLLGGRDLRNFPRSH